MIQVLAAFDGSAPPQVTGVAAGLAFEGVVLEDWGHCGSLALTDPGWPESGSGIAVSWTSAVEERYFPVLWVAAYSYAGGSVTLVDHPTNGAPSFTDAAIPANIVAATRIGEFGFGTLGYCPCDAPTSATDFSVDVILRESIPGFDPPSRAPHTIEAVDYADTQLREALFGAEAQAISRVFPGWTSSDTLVTCVDGSINHCPDMSRLVRFHFGSDSSATAAVDDLQEARGVLLAARTALTAEVHSGPNDPYFTSDPVTSNPQWNLQNRGTRISGECPDAVAGMDMRIDLIPNWYTALADRHPVIGISDGGVWDDHEDLEVIGQWGTDEYDFCGRHGTRMAGLGAAKTNNELGIAGVCPSCAIYDIPVPASDQLDLCDDHGYYERQEQIDVALWEQAMSELLQPPHGWLSVINMSHELPETAPAVLDLMVAAGVTPVVSGGNGASATPTYWSARDVLAVPGMTWHGEFWSPANTCVHNGHNFPGSPAGPMHSVAAPATGSAITTDITLDQDLGWYQYSQVQTSGAAAQASGLAAIMSRVPVSSHPDFFHMVPAAIVMGMIEGSALEYPMDPSAPGSDPVCSTCPRAYYGRGRINAAGAVHLATEWGLQIEDEPREGLFTRHVLTVEDSGADWDSPAFVDT